MNAIDHFVKKLGRDPKRVKGNMVEYRGIQELDKVIDISKKILADMGVIYSITKHPILRGFVITIPDQEIGG